MTGFEVVAEVSMPARADFTPIRRQVWAMSSVASAFLVPDNHIGRASLSSVAVGREVQASGGRPVVCLNSRDRNLLGLRRDLLTAAAYGFERLLFVRGDRPSAGTRAPDLSVSTMLTEARAAGAGFRVGVAVGLGPLPGWKREADFGVTQVSFSTEDLFRWRDSVAFDGPVFAGVMVLASARTAAGLHDISVPADLMERVGRDRDAGVAHACEQIEAVRAHGGFAGVHLVALGRYRDVAARLPDRRREPRAPARHHDRPPDAGIVIERQLG